MYEISVIIPVFNTEMYLRDCLDSVCASTIFDSCEILVIDDGSSDGSLRIAKEYEAHYDNIFVYSYPNRGVSSARNRGIKEARGKYIFFLDSDDQIEKNYLQKLYDCMEIRGCDMVCAGFSRLEKEGRNPVPVIRPVLSLNSVLSGCEYLEKRMDADDWDNQVWCVLYKSAFLKETQVTFCETIRIYEDILFINQVLLYASRVCVLPEYGYMYRMRQGSLIQCGLSEEDVENCLLVLKEFEKRYDHYSRMQKHAVGRLYFRIISMILYDMGEIHSEKKKQHYEQLAQLKLWKPLLVSVSNRKEAVKWLIFRIHWGLYYPMVKKMKNSNDSSGG